VIAITEDARLVSLRMPAPHVLYNIVSPYGQDAANSKLFSNGDIHIVVHAGTDSLAMAALHHAMVEIIPDVTDVRYRTFQQLEDSDLNRERMLASVSRVFALLALLITGLGMYGVLMRHVSLRAREIGIRMALGAKRSRVIIEVARKPIIAIGIGLLAGEAIAVPLMRGIRHLVDTSSSPGVSTFLFGAGMILLVSTLAVCIPARHMASVTPTEVLRND
jgi:ABC-type antimicrobial peptide transport system permease subunit